MSATLEIEIVDRGTPAPAQGGPAPQPAAPAPESAGLPSPGAAPESPPAPVAPETVEPEPDGAELALGGRSGPWRKADWENEDSSPAGWKDEIDRFNGGGEPEAAGGGQSAGLDRLLYQAGLGRMGNLYAMVDKHQENLAAGATGGQTMMSGLGVAQAAGGVAAEGLDAASSVVRTGSGVASSLVEGNPMQAMQQVSGAMQGLAQKIPVVGEAVAAGLGLVESAAMGLVDVFQAVTGRGKELAEYSPEISMAVAMQEIEQIMDDMREAQEMGGDYAKAIDMESQMYDLWRESLIPIRKVVVDVLQRFLDEYGDVLKQMPKMVENGVKGITATLQAGWPTIEAGMNMLTGGAPRMMGMVNQVVRGVGQIEENTRPNDDAQAMGNLFNVLEGARQGQFPGQQDRDDFGGGAPPAQIIEP